jgi:hypothetical protein
MHQNKEYILIDSPGFEDTEGPIMDIVNGVIAALKTARSVKPVIVFNYKSIGARLEKMRKLT